MKKLISIILVITILSIGVVFAVDMDPDLIDNAVEQNPVQTEDEQEMQEPGFEGEEPNVEDSSDKLEVENDLENLFEGDMNPDIMEELKSSTTIELPEGFIETNIDIDYSSITGSIFKIIVIAVGSLIVILLLLALSRDKDSAKPKQKMPNTIPLPKDDIDLDINPISTEDEEIYISPIEEVKNEEIEEVMSVEDFVEEVPEDLNLVLGVDGIDSSEDALDLGLADNLPEDLELELGGVEEDIVDDFIDLDDIDDIDKLSKAIAAKEKELELLEKEINEEVKEEVVAKTEVAEEAEPVIEEIEEKIKEAEKEEVKKVETKKTKKSTKKEDPVIDEAIEEVPDKLDVEEILEATEEDTEEEINMVEDFLKNMEKNMKEDKNK